MPVKEDEMPHTGGFLQGKCILIISAEPWNGLHMSKHHLAEALVARGARILWLDRPSCGFGPVTLQRDGCVERVGYHHWLRGIERLPKTVQRWYHGKLLAAIEASSGQQVDMVWSFDGSRLVHFPRAGRLFIFHPVDLTVLDARPEAARVADLVLTVSRTILNRIQLLAPDVPAFHIGHALDPIWLSGSRPNVAHAAGKRPVVACAGNMAIRYLDWEVLHAEAAAHPEADFRFIGPYDPLPTDPWFLRLRKLSNVAFKGLHSKEQMVPELRAADVLLLCYRADLWPDELSNSHKLLEYLSTGDVIVASATDEYAGIEADVLLMANSRWEHPVLLAQVLNDMERYNAPERRAARIAMAAAHTTTAHVDQLERIIQEECEGKRS